VWEPITNLPDDWPSLTDHGVARLREDWEARREVLPAVVLKDFRQRLARRWAIETGIIERLYDLDRGTTELLVERGFDAALIRAGATDVDPEWLAGVLEDHRAGLEMVFDIIVRGRPLSVSFVKELHALLTRGQAETEAMDQFGHRLRVPLEHGRFKSRPNNPRRPDGTVHEYCPPEQVDSEMERLLAWHEAHCGVPPEVEAAWMHHRFAQIHPFQDGNGRVARALASHVLIVGGGFPFIVDRDERGTYLDALEAADAGDLAPLAERVAGQQQAALGRALTLLADAEADHQRLDQALQSALRQLTSRDEGRDPAWEHARATAQELRDHAEGALIQLRDVLLRDVLPHLPGASVFTGAGGPQDERAHWFRFQVTGVSGALDYFANLDAFHAWARLRIDHGEQRTELLVSFHGYGRAWGGTIAATVGFSQSVTDPEEGRQHERTVPLVARPFVVSFRDARADLEARFDTWLEEALVAGIERWRRGLGE
jgi:fido (protein-threonine AMPylation protein)